MVKRLCFVKKRQTAFACEKYAYCSVRYYGGVHLFQGLSLKKRILTPTYP